MYEANQEWELVAEAMDRKVEFLARKFHELYEELAPAHGWETQEKSRKQWDEVPAENRNLMLAVTREMLRRGYIQ